MLLLYFSVAKLPTVLENFLVFDLTDSELTLDPSNALDTSSACENILSPFSSDCKKSPNRLRIFGEDGLVSPLIRCVEVQVFY